MGKKLIEKILRSRRAQVGIAVTAIILIIAGSSVASVLSQFEISGTPDVTTPLMTTGRSFIVRNGSTVIETVGNAMSMFVPNSQYWPGIDVQYSQPFTCSANGTPITTPDYTPASDPLWIGSNVYYYNELYQAVDVLFRTNPNPPSLASVSYTSTLSPFSGLTHPHRGGSMKFLDSVYGVVTTGSTQDVTGELILAMNTASWNRIVRSNQRATLTYLGTPMEFESLTTYGRVPAPGKTLSDAITACAKKFGNSQVTVDATVSVACVDGMFEYEYDRAVTLDNGTVVTVHVQTRSARIGILNSYKSTQQSTGLITNLAEDALNTIDAAETNPSTTVTGSAQPNYAAKSIPGVQTYTLEGSMTYTGDDATYGASNPIGGGVIVGSHVTTLPGTAPVIDLNSVAAGGAFSLPTTMSDKITVTIQPKTVVDVAKVSVKYSELFWDDTWLNTDTNVPQFTTKDARFPYKVTVQNVYAITRFIVKMAVITENSVQVIAQDGQPITPQDVTEFNFNNVIAIPPDAGDRNITRPIDTFSWPKFWADVGAMIMEWLNNPWVIIVIAIVVVVLLGIAYSIIRRFV